MSLVWYYPARGFCSPGYTLTFENHSGSILPWEWRILDCEHGIVFRESQSASERTVAMHILGATANRAVRILGDLNFASVPIPMVIRPTERRWKSSISNSTER